MHDLFSVIKTPKACYFADDNTLESSNKELETMFTTLKTDIKVLSGFILGEMRYFQFGFWSVPCNCLNKIPQNETHCALFHCGHLTRIKFFSGNVLQTLLKYEII